MNIPTVIGHRGCAALAPENTLAGIRHAAALGVRWVEFDVRLCADGGLVLMHDDTLDRTTSGRGRVRDGDSSDMRRLDAGGWFSADFAGEPVPDLEDAMALLGALDMGANIEIKAAPDLAAHERVDAHAANLLRRPYVTMSCPNEGPKLTATNPDVADSAQVPGPSREDVTHLRDPAGHQRDRHLADGQ